MTKNKNLGTKMKVIDLEKRFELMSWAVLSAINVLLLMGFMSSKSEVSNLLFSFLLCTVTLLIALLVFNSKRNLTVCRHGVHYRNLFGQCRHMHARQVQFIHHYSFFGLRLVLIMGEKYICIAPFYSLISNNSVLKRYDNDLFDWVKELTKNQ